MLVSISLGFLLIGLGVAYVPELMHSLQRSRVRNQLEFDILRARNESMAKGTRGVFLISPDGQSYLFGFDHLPYNLNPSIEEMLFIRYLDSEFTATSSRDLIFNAFGRTIDQTGQLTTTVVSLRDRGDVFSIATVSPIGFVNIE